MRLTTKVLFKWKMEKVEEGLHVSIAGILPSFDTSMLQSLISLQLWKFSLDGLCISRVEAFQFNPN